MRCRVGAAPLAPDYQRSLEPIQCVDVERFPRLPAANEMGRVGRQVVVIVRFVKLAGVFLTDWTTGFVVDAGEY